MYTLIRSEKFRKWLKKLKDRKAKAQILLRLKRLEQGNFGDHRYLRNKISELIFNIGPGYRIFYTIDNKEIVLLFMRR
ncbi:MAG: type II toxin-antitoxin system RelE/ParE family toxin [Fidelibacterota bacterium]